MPLEKRGHDGQVGMWLLGVQNTDSFLIWLNARSRLNKLSLPGRIQHLPWNIAILICRERPQVALKGALSICGSPTGLPLPDGRWPLRVGRIRVC